MNNRLPGLPELVAFAMPAGDEQTALDGRIDSYLAGKKKKKPEFFMGISGHPVHLASLKDSQVPYFSPSLTNPSSGFICLKIAQEKNHPSAILYSNQVKWKLCKETYPSVIPQLSSGWNLLHSASCPPPLPGSLWGDGWVGREARVSDGGDCLCSSISRRSKPSYYSARVGQSQSSIILGGGGCFHGTPGNLASHKH